MDRKGTPKCQNKKYGPKRPYESLYNSMARTLLWAIKRGRTDHGEMTLSYEDFMLLVEITQCHYCNANIHWAPPYGRRDADGKINERYHLGRKNNSLPYTPENCVVCCPSCNYTKGSRLSYEEMVAVGKLRRIK